MTMPEACPRSTSLVRVRVRARVRVGVRVRARVSATRARVRVSATRASPTTSLRSGRACEVVEQRGRRRVIVLGGHDDDRVRRLDRVRLRLRLRVRGFGFGFGLG